MSKDETTPIDQTENTDQETDAVPVSRFVEKFGMHPAVVRNLITSGFFPGAFLKVTGKLKRWMIPREEFDRFVVRPKGSPRKKATSKLVASRASHARAAIKTAHGYGKAEIERMAELAEEGRSAAEIAVRFGIVERIVSDLLAHAALYPKKPVKTSRQLKRVPEEVLIELYVTAHLPTGEILRRLQIGYTALYVNLRHYEIPLRAKHYRQLNAERNRTLRQLAVAESLPPEVIADRLQLSVANVKRQLSRLGLPDPAATGSARIRKTVVNRPPIFAWKYDEAIKRAALEKVFAGESVPSVARKLKVSEGSIYGWRREAVRKKLEESNSDPAQ